MNAVEIEEAISQLADEPFDPENFPYAFLEAFDNKQTTIKRLRAGASNKSDLGGVLQTNNIHIATCDAGQVTKTLTALKESPATAKTKAKFILATDGVDFEAEELANGETVACAYKDFPDHFGFFLPLAGITTIRQISENAFDIRATSRMNRLYVELLKENPEWGTAERRHDMNHFMARLIFCFFAEDTGIRKPVTAKTVIGKWLWVLVAMLMIPPFDSLELRIRYIRGVIGRLESAAYKAGISEMTSPKVGTRPPSTLRIAQCEPEAKDLPLSGAGAALPRHRFPECGRRWRPRAS